MRELIECFGYFGLPRYVAAARISKIAVELVHGMLSELRDVIAVCEYVDPSKKDAPAGLNAPNPFCGKSIGCRAIAQRHQ